MAVWVLAILVLAVGSASAVVAPKTLTVGTVSGEFNVAVPVTVSIPITINDPAGLGGVAFTLNYNPALFTFVGLEPAPSGWTINNPDQDSPLGFRVPAGQVLNYPDTTTPANYYNPYKSEAPYTDRQYTKLANASLFFQFNDMGAPGAPVGRVLVSGASAEPLTGTILFQAKFTIKGGVNGTTYPIGIVRSIINNPPAGYTTDTLIPALVGVGDKVGDKYTTTNFPVIPATLVAGGITVSAPVFTLGGKATYGTAGGANAVGCSVTLRRVTPDGDIFSGQTTVGADGNYSFTGKQAGDYKIFVQSLDPNFNDYNSPSAITLAANKTDANAVLPAKPQPARVSSTVTSGNIPGLLVKVVDPSDNVMGIYSIDPNTGAWSSPLLPYLASGQYGWYLVYGSIQSAKGATTFNTSVLKSISGTIAGFPQGGGAVTASSVLGKLTKTLQVAADGNYEITNLVAASDYIVSAVATGKPLTYYNGKTDVNEATAVDIFTTNATGVNFNFAPPAQYITGWIKESGTGLASITVYGFEVNTFALISTQTDGSGNYSLSVPVGTYEVFVIKSNGKIFYFYNENGTPTQNESGALLRTVAGAQTVANTNIDITECDKTLGGKVTYRTATGDPAANVLITAQSSTGRALGLTGQDGAYTVGGLCNGVTYAVEMKPMAGNYAVQTTSIVAGTDTTKNFVIDTGAVLSGTVTDQSTTAAVAGAMIYLKDKDTGALVGGRIYFSAADGKYSIRDIKSGEYTLEVTHPDYKGYAVNLVIGSDMTQNVALDKGAHFKGNVTGSGKALPGATIIVTRPGAASVYTVTNSAGNYSVYGVDSSNSDYIIIAQARGFERQAKTAQTPATAGTTADFALLPPTQYYTLSGVVKTDAQSGAEISGAIVLVSSASKNFFASATTGTNGAYSVANLIASNDYKIVVVQPGLPTQERSNINVSGNKTEDFTIPVGKDIGGTITGDTTIPAGTKIYVFLYKGTTYQGFQVAAANGSFRFKGLADGADYKVLAVAAGYAPRWWNGQTSIGTADTITATKLDVTIPLLKQ
jgi:predicted aconitase with swiveling domain